MCKTRKKLFNTVLLLWGYREHVWLCDALHALCDQQKYKLVIELPAQNIACRKFIYSVAIIFNIDLLSIWFWEERTALGTELFSLEGEEFSWLVLWENASWDNYEVEGTFTAMYKHISIFVFKQKPQVEHKMGSLESCSRKVNDSKNW